MKAVILAGGKGKRLRPFTNIVPKPLLPVNERPILEHNILYMKKFGITELLVSIGYLGYQIKNYFGDGQELGVRIEYIEEKHPLGTAGCLHLMKKQLTETFLLYGGDNLTNLNLTKFIAFHKAKQALLTVGLFEHTEKLPWGIYELDDQGAVCEFLEKPSYTRKAGTMIFCLEPRILEFIPQQEGVVNLTDHVIPTLLERKEPIFGYPFRDYWVDIGKIEDYQQMNESEK